MERRYARLTHIDNNHEITKHTDPVFCNHLHRALLLALREQGFLNEMQYRYAEERLRHRQGTDYDKEG